MYDSLSFYGRCTTHDVSFLADLLFSVFALTMVFYSYGYIEGRGLFYLPTIYLLSFGAYAEDGSRKGMEVLSILRSAVLFGFRNS